MRYTVELVPQSQGMGCWAASIAMILGWSQQASFDPGGIAANPGGTDYTPSLTNGLDPNDSYILGRNGFVTEPPVCYSPAFISSLLASYGSLWVASLAPLAGVTGRQPHIRVVTGFDKGRVWVNDPWPVNKGSRYSKSFQAFFGQMEDLGARELKEPTPVYVAYLA